MATSTLKAAILVAVVVIGVIVLRSAFPDNASEGIAPPPSGGTTQPSVSSPVSTSPSSSPSATPTQKLRKKKTTIQILNGTSKTGFAAAWAQALEADGWKAPQVANGNTTQTTTISYRPDFLAEAQALKDTYFPTARLQEAGASVPTDVDIQVLLGEDAEAPPSGG